MPKAFTIKSNGGIANQLVTTIQVIFPNSVNNTNVQAIWDTGATATVITQNVVNELGLIPTGMSIVFTANGETTQNTYIVDIGLPNGVVVKDVTVTCAIALSGGCEALIGMDIISLGDFSITNHNGSTCMSFRIPSLHEIDYTQNIDFKMPIPKIKIGTIGSNRTPKKPKRKK